MLELNLGMIISMTKEKRLATKLTQSDFCQNGLPLFKKVIDTSCFEFRLGISGAYNVVLLDQTDFDCFAQYVKLGVAF